MTENMTLFAPTPEKIVVDGQPVLGLFDDTVPCMNPEDFAYQSVMGKPAGRIKQWAHYKRFQYFGMMSDELFCGCGIADMRFVSVLFVYVFHRPTGRMQRKLLKIPTNFALNMSDSPLSGRSTLKAPGISVELGYEDAPRRKTLKVRVGKSLHIDAAFDETAAGFEPISICTKAGRNGWVYANKVAGLPVTGTLSCEFGEYDLQALKASGHHDFSAGYMRRETCWEWACFSTEDDDGDRVGLNISCGVNETSFSENACWVNGARYPLAGCHFEYDRANRNSPWRIRSTDGAVDLHFTPEGLHEDRLNAAILATDFRQFFGCFSGQIHLPNGVINLTAKPGFVEDHFSRW